MLKFFMNQKVDGYLRGLESEFGDSTNAIRTELNRFEEAGLLSSSKEGNRKYFKANESHPLFKDIQNLIFKHVGLHEIIARVCNRLGHLEEVYLIGSLAEGRDSGIIDLAFIGDIQKHVLLDYVGKAEEMISRKIRFVVFENSILFDRDILQRNVQHLKIWNADER